MAMIILKVTVFLVCMVAARGGTIGTYFSPATIGATSSINFAPNTKARSTPAPIYETEASNRDIAITRASEQGFFTPFDSNGRNTYTSNNGADTLSRPSNLYSSSVGKPVSYYPTSTSPFISEVEAGPVTYTTHTHSTPLIDTPYSIPIRFKPSLQYNPNTPVVQNVESKNKIVYDAPSVSHVLFEGLGTTYKW